MKKDHTAVILLCGGEKGLSGEELSTLEAEGFTLKPCRDGSENADLVLLYVDAAGRLEKEDAVRRLLNETDIPAVYLLHPDCNEPEKYSEEFPAYGYAAQGSPPPVLAASLRAALGLAERGKVARVKKQPRKEEGDRREPALTLQPHRYGLEGEELFRAFMANLPVYVFVKDPEGRYLFANEAYRRLGDAEPSERIGKTDGELFPTDIARTITRNDEKARKSGKPLEIVEEVPYAGTVQTHLVIKFPIAGQDKGPPLLGGIALDITDLAQTRKSLEKTLEEKSALLKELQHRVKNSLFMISSLIGIEESQSETKEVQTLLRRLKERVFSVAELYSALYQTGGVRTIRLDNYLHKEISNIKEAYFPENPNIVIAETFDTVTVSVKDAAAYGLIVNELVTNSIRHAFPEGMGGTIWIDLEKEHGRAAVRVSDDGIGLPEGVSLEETGGSGIRLSKVLAEQLGGVLKYEHNDRTVFVLEVPLSG